MEHRVFVYETIRGDEIVHKEMSDLLLRRISNTRLTAGLTVGYKSKSFFIRSYLAEANLKGGVVTHKIVLTEIDCPDITL